MNKHTPGPWQLARFNPERATVEVETVARGDELPDQGCFIALVGAYGAGIEDAPEARLIAAAPDLLAALEYILDWSPDGSKWSGETARDMGRAAIAKARGEC
jgi:hypothetical protein